MRSMQAMFLFVVSLGFLLSGCSSSRLMPSSVERPTMNIKYQEVIAFYNTVEASKMTIDDLKNVTDIDLNNGQDITILGPTYVRNFFMKDSYISIENLPLEIQECIRKNNCRGYLMVKKMKSNSGFGNFISRWAKFKHQDIKKEWKLEILFLADFNGKIVYKEILSAMPEQVEIIIKTNPLGPLQNVLGDAKYKYRF